MLYYLERRCWGITTLRCPHTSHALIGSRSGRYPPIPHSAASPAQISRVRCYDRNAFGEASMVTCVLRSTCKCTACTLS